MSAFTAEPTQLRTPAPDANMIWAAMRQEAQQLIQQEPALNSLMQATILEQDSLSSALALHLASQLDSPELSKELIREIIAESHAADATICVAGELDILAVRNRDAACNGYLPPLLFFKGYQALQAYRVSHWAWQQNRTAIALYIQGRSSVRLNVDIHPAARIGSGVMLDHASGIVVGETTVIENDVSILQGVTLGGTGKGTGDRHPKIKCGVLIGAGAKILGNITVGENAKVGAGSVVLKDVPPRATVVGVPASVVGINNETPALTMDQSLESPD